MLYSSFLFFLAFLLSCGPYESVEEELDSTFLTEEEKEKDKLITSSMSDKFFLSKILNNEGSCDATKKKVQSYYLNRIEKDYFWYKKMINEDSDLIWIGSPEPVVMEDGLGEKSYGSPKSYSKTNTQISGVDEADMVKTDGVHAFQLDQDKIRITKIWPAEELELVYTVELGSYAQDMFYDIESKRLYVFLESYGLESSVAEASSDSFFPSSSTIKLIAIDVTDVEKPKILKNFVFPGYYWKSRMKGNVIYFVLDENELMPENIFWNFDLERDKSYNRVLLSQSYEENKKIILSKDLNYWIPRSYESLTEDKISYSDFDCSRVYFPKVPNEFGRTRLISFNTNDFSYKEDIVMSRSSHVYASNKAFYLVANHWRNYVEDSSYLNLTYLHRFDISDFNTRYKGSGVVEGSLLNQFSLDEYNDHIRIATTIDEVVTSDSPSPINNTDATFETEINTTNKVTVFSLEEDHLKRVGETPNLVSGERIYSVRFMKERGFVVTFKQVDPLFTLDLSNPAQPTTLGELKVPGFSTYIHVLDENHLLTIGRNADEETGVQKELKLSVFDISDMTLPKEVSTYLELKDLWSEAEWDHHAFSYYASRSTLAIPVQLYDGSYKSALSVYMITKDYEIEKSALLDLSDFSEENFQVRRSIFVTSQDNKTYLYPILTHGVLSYNLDKLSERLSKVVFPSES